MSYSIQKLPLVKIVFVFSIFFISSALIAQDLDEDFLNALDPDLREQLEEDTDKQSDKDNLDKLLNSNSSVSTNKKILEELKDQLDDLEKRFLQDETNINKNLKRFGDNFFTSLQASFMPINVPNIGSDYIVDVGDKFSLSIIGKLHSKEDLTVSKDGTLDLNEYGRLFVAGKTLADVQKEVDNLFLKSTVGLEPYLSIFELRDVQVLVLGGVKNPGIYTVSGGSNLLGIINVAGGISEKGSFRKIEHKRNGVKKTEIDLYDVISKGQFNFKDSIRSGDVIFVHPFSFEVPVTGGVNNEAIFEMLQGETVQDIISFAGGFSAGFYNFNNLNVHRVDLNQSKILSIPASQIEDVKLMPRDSVVVPQFINTGEKLKTVTINGMVNRPGKYYISDDTSLSELLVRAGGYKDGAYPYGAALFRKEALDKEVLYAEINYSDTINFIISNIGKPGSQIDAGVVGLLSDELKSQKFAGRVVAEFDLGRLERNQSLDIILTDGDIIEVPALQKVVYLFGDLQTPSIVTYDPNLGAKEYIKLAGGVRPSAVNDVIIIDPDGTSRNFSRRWGVFQNKEQQIYPGSIIYVPRNIGKTDGLIYASTVAPILSSLAISLASLNSIKD